MDIALNNRMLHQSIKVLSRIWLFFTLYIDLDSCKNKIELEEWTSVCGMVFREDKPVWCRVDKAVQYGFQGRQAPIQSLIFEKLISSARMTSNPIQ